MVKFHGMTGCYTKNFTIVALLVPEVDLDKVRGVICAIFYYASGTKKFRVKEITFQLKVSLTY